MLSLVKMVPLELGELSVYRGWVSWSSLGYPLGGPVGGYARQATYRSVGYAKPCRMGAL